MSVDMNDEFYQNTTPDVRNINAHKPASCKFVLAPADPKALQIVTVKFAADLGADVCERKVDHRLIVTSNRCIPVKNTFG